MSVPRLATRSAAAVCLSVLAATVTTTVATADADASGGGGRVSAQGPCEGPAHWKIKAKPDDSAVEVEAEVDSNVRGQKWSWVLKHNGSRVAQGTSRTAGPSGSFTVARRTPDAAGSDTYVLRATHASTTCVARVSL